MALALAAIATPQSAFAFDAGVKPPLLVNPLPGAVSRPFEIVVAQSETVPQPLDFEIAVAGFDLDPDPVAGQRIGSLDMVSDSGDFDDKEIYSNGPGENGLRTWTLNWQLADPIIATVEDGVALTTEGDRIPDAGSTLIGFTVPGNYHGFRLKGLSLRFNQAARGAATQGVGAVNPTLAGNYLIRSRIVSTAPQSSVSVASARVRVGFPVRETRLAVDVDRNRVRPGGLVRFSLRTTNRTRDTASIWLRGHRLKRVRVGPSVRRFSWLTKARFRGQLLRFRIKPENGPARRVTVRVKH